MSKESKIILLVAALVGIAIAALIMFVNAGRSDPMAVAEKIVREDSHKVGEGEVTLVEFGDYQCPACAQSHSVVNQLREEYEGKLVFVYRHFPLPGHPNAQPAAEAAEAAGAQGKFWEMHDKLFESQTQWSSLADPTSVFAQYAEELELDKDRFATDVTMKASKDFISADQTDGYAVSVSGTPTFFVNGKRQTQIDYDTLKKAIETELNGN